MIPRQKRLVEYVRLLPLAVDPDTRLMMIDGVMVSKMLMTNVLGRWRSFISNDFLVIVSPRHAEN